MSEHTEEQRDTERLLEHAARIHAPAAWTVPAAVAALLLGVAAFAGGLLVAPGRAWASLLANFLFWTGLAQAVVVVAAVFRLAPARWGHTVQRASIGLSLFLPFSLLLLLGLWFGRGAIFAWLDEPGRLWWLDASGMLGRDALIIFATGAVSLWFVLLSIRPDLGLLRGEVAHGGRLWQWATRGWRGDMEERARSRRLLHALSPIVILGYVFGYSVLSVDLAMSLAPAFRSTIFPVIYFIGQFYAALAATAILAAAWRRAEGFGGLVTPSYAQDLANLTWGFAIFWGYVSFSQYMAIWYTNLPHEAWYFQQRWRTPPWEAWSWLALFLAFVVPFLAFFSRPLKRNLAAVALVGGAGALGILLHRFLDVFPYVPALGPSTFGLVELGTTLGFAGAAALPYLWFTRQVPLFPVTDPLFLDAVAMRNVEV